MKKLAAILACVLVLSMMLTACGGTGASRTSEGKQLVVQLGPDPETLDPALNLSLIHISVDASSVASESVAE